MYKIYRRLNLITGKSYIGLTSKEEKERWRQHLSESKTVNHNNYNSKLNKAIRKYGDVWQVTILEDNIKTKQEAELREIYFIYKYNSFKKGYNSNNGGSLPAYERLYKPIIIYNPKTKEKTEFISITQAVAVTGFSRGGLINVLKNRRKDIYGLEVFYKNPNQEVIQDA